MHLFSELRRYKNGKKYGNSFIDSIRDLYLPIILKEIVTSFHIENTIPVFIEKR